MLWSYVSVLEKNDCVIKWFDCENFIQAGRRIHDQVLGGRNIIRVKPSVRRAVVVVCRPAAVAVGWEEWIMTHQRANIALIC